MNEEKAKFILSAYRPGHEDRDEPEYREALEFAGARAELREWLDDQIAFDRSVIAALSGVPVPKDLRGNILAGAHVSAGRRPSWRVWASVPAVRALAAVIVIGVFVLAAVMFRPDAQADWKRAAIAKLTEMSEKEDTLDLRSSDAKAIYDWLAETDPDLVPEYPVAMNNVGPYGCKAVRSGDGLVTIVCFEHDGKMFHLASYRMREGAPASEPERPIVEQEGKWLTATWVRGEFAHMLITSDRSVERAGLLRVIEEFNA